jgi:hypothetical protein
MLGASRPQDRLPNAEAFLIALLRPELQLSAASKVVTGELKIAALRQMSKEPGNRAVHERRNKRAGPQPSRERVARFPKADLRKVRGDVKALERSVQRLIESFGKAALSQDEAGSSADAELLELRGRVRRILGDLRVL